MPTPEDCVIRTAVETRARLHTKPDGNGWCVYVHGRLTVGRGPDPVSATRDWCQRNGVEWRLPE